MLSYLIAPDSITMIVDGTDYVVPRTSAQASMIIDELRKNKPDEARLVKLADLATAVSLYSDGVLVIEKDGSVKRNGKKLPDSMAAKVNACFRDGVPFRHLAAFFQRLDANPSKRAVEELYKFLEHQGMPITAEGMLIGYKGVGKDYLDIHSHTFLNKPGCRHTMKRNDVCDNADVGCSYGFHVGSYEYANDWKGCDGHLMVVMVDPADVVSIPKDCNCQKLRCCEYVVVCESQGRLGDSAVRDATRPYAGGFLEPEDDGELLFEHDEPAAETAECAKARKAGAKRAEGLLAKGIMSVDVDAFFSKSALRKLRAAYGGTDEALEAYLGGFREALED